MKVLVTGATGFVGGGAGRALRARGHEVLALVRKVGASPGLRESGATEVLGDLDSGQVPAAREVDAIIHCALAPFQGMRVSQAELNRLAALDEAWSLNLLRTGAGRARAFVYLSGIWVYGDTGSAVADETTAPRPFRIAEFKVHAEQLVAAEARRLGYASMVTLRAGTLYGPSGSFEKFFLGPMRNKRKVRWFGSGEQSMCLIHVDDLGRACVQALEHGGYEIYNIVDDEPVAAKVWMSYLAQQLGAPAPGGIWGWLAPLVTGALGEPLTRSQRVSNAKARARLGWAPAWPTYREGLKALASTPADPR
jgi:nucleoside-diphosphate-sugar epimerase